MELLLIGIGRPQFPVPRRRPADEKSTPTASRPGSRRASIRPYTPVTASAKRLHGKSAPQLPAHRRFYGDALRPVHPLSGADGRQQRQIMQNTPLLRQKDGRKHLPLPIPPHHSSPLTARRPGVGRTGATLSTEESLAKILRVNRRIAATKTGSATAASTAMRRGRCRPWRPTRASCSNGSLRRISRPGISNMPNGTPQHHLVPLRTAPPAGRHPHLPARRRRRTARPRRRNGFRILAKTN